MNNDPECGSTLSRHFKILREAGLIRSERKGVEVLNRSRCDEFREQFKPMIHSILAAYQAEAKSRAKPRIRRAA